MTPAAGASGLRSASAVKGVNGVTLAFLVIGGIGLAVLVVSLLVGDLLHFGHPDADGPFSLPAVAGFIGAFGFIGAIGAELAPDDSTWELLAGGIAGLLAAVPTAWLATRLARAAMNMRTDATPTKGDLVGTMGVVVTPIPVTGYGEVTVSLGGLPLKVNARADHAIPRGARVFVIEAPSSTSVIVEETPAIEEP
jgi:membrane protein implicated in regulation of membrane protease activity